MTATTENPITSYEYAKAKNGQIRTNGQIFRVGDWVLVRDKLYGEIKEIHYNERDFNDVAFVIHFNETGWNPVAVLTKHDPIVKLSEKEKQLAKLKT